MSEIQNLKDVIDFYHSMNDTDEDDDVVAMGDDASAELDALLAENALLRKQLDEAMEKLDFYNKATATAFLERMKK